MRRRLVPFIPHEVSREEGSRGPERFAHSEAAARILADMFTNNNIWNQEEAVTTLTSRLHEQGHPLPSRPTLDKIRKDLDIKSIPQHHPHGIGIWSWKWIA